ncbi:PDR/VanB family oxidoreductase [Curvibacter sp. HBC61]|uniref:PDR/VanB family oxidoreductase n=1 Tax=Curvibacter cyanobacteriorum TaxID=3026422 RepID=A0ABT5MVC0_9BURK|nr:PDR/VanB family oxidoreductase [Curvibacter sp. HBC61]MDD0838002.1 PDR/VanB family oxidoreductase [Curvibacter sp. HBC61]
MTATTLTVRLARKSAETAQICRLELEPLPGQSLPGFTPGAHLDLHLAPGLVRPYSLVNAPDEGGVYRLGVLLDPASRGGSRAVHALQAGQTLTISAPVNHFELAPQAQHHLLLGGGIGITPLLSMAQHLARQGQSFSLHYSARSRDQAAFLPRLAEADLQPHVQTHFDDGDAAQKLDLAALLAQPQAGTHLYVCGPKGYMDAVLGAARQAGWPEAQLHSEVFQATVQSLPDDAEFEVEIASSGLVVTVPPELTIAQALEQAGVRLMTSCEQGVCGTCLTRVLSGQPDHRDSYLTEEEQAANDQCLPCCSRSRSPRLVLDL